MSRNLELRIGDAERDEVIAALREHFALGRLDRGELEERLEITLAAKTVGDLRKITADLPSLSAQQRPGRERVRPAPHWRPGDHGWSGGWPSHLYHPPRFPLLPLLCFLFLFVALVGLALPFFALFFIWWLGPSLFVLARRGRNRFSGTWGRARCRLTE